MRKFLIKFLIIHIKIAAKLTLEEFTKKKPA